jgi:protein Mpv17
MCDIANASLSLGNPLQYYDSLVLKSPLLAKACVSCCTYASAETFRKVLKSTTAEPKDLGAEALASTSAESKDLGVETAPKTKSLRDGFRGIILMAAIGGLVHGPYIHFWFAFLQKLCPGTSAHSIFAKVVLDQGIGLPSLYVFIMMATGLAEGKTIAQCHAAIRQNIRRTLRLAWTCWPPVHGLNFAVVPLNRQALVVQLGGFVWACFLCSNTRSAVKALDSDELSSSKVKVL